MTFSLRRSALALVAGGAVVAVALSGCSFKQDSTPAPTRAPSTSGVAAELLPYYEQAVEWTECSDVFECATVTAPLDWSDTSAGDIDLAIIRHTATGTDPLGSLLVNPGGPGASGVALVRDSLDYSVGADLQVSYDVVGFDPRGVGDSTAVSCYDASGMDAYLYDLPTGARGSDEWTAELDAANADFAAACDANSDGILPYITTENSARDMDLLRGVLGDDQLNYLGYSYGTFLGATYAKLFPENVGRLVLDGAIDPAVSGLDVGTTQGIGFESALRAYMADCLAGEDCPFAGTVDDAMADLGTLLASVDRSPLANADGRMLGSSSLMTAIIAALYSQGSWPYLTTALTSALAGDPSVAFVLADFYYAREDGVYTDNSTEAFAAYNCMDYPLDYTADEKAAAQARLEADAPTIAPYWSGPDQCEEWVYPATGVREEITAAGAAPIVVVGTTNDPATPYEWSVALADQLESGVLVTRVGEGHTGYNKGNTCVDDIVENYFLTGDVPAEDVVCE
ncbi:pimeloyl-ACP methyl ester carboxylesterase [Microbacterium halimionae]|uniref:Pimeloyl-ACP methyl ester carboxylesterase n=1 Tax=Microbacterium halimionae TaxID=1526413 RepID=A0A7W3JME0_9MICO|nr:alpha/beta hydrolase [Microbacterium halimionae]MBA8815541.1 pimeloyl-ACP methyl ester carboxylesterase [Microbacterium halimionae]NII95588.1 pimeloyl-ACP methyl ester carboxylesterase [Microbacterium halimionae]